MSMQTTEFQAARARAQDRRIRVAVARQAEPHVRRVLGLGAIAVAGVLAATALLSTNVAAQEWLIQRVDAGTKPALGVTPEGDPVIVYMLERQEGWVRVASLVDGAWQVDQVAEGYFYGPPDIAVGPDGVAHAAYHDHQDSTFKPDKGDAVYVQGAAGAWSTTTAADDGHDGWDNRISVDSEGRPHMVGIDPLEFGSQDGVEYYSLDDDGAWNVEPVGSGPQTYHFAVSVAIDRTGTPWVTFYDQASSDLKVSSRRPDGWSVETVDEDGTTGLYSEMVIGSDGAHHISYLESLDDANAVVKHAFRSGPDEAWQISEVDRLDRLFGTVGDFFTGARNITGIDLDADGNAWIVYSDEAVMKLAQQVDDGWAIETVTEASDAPLGQIVSLALDSDDRPHIAFADVTSKGPLDGNIWYASRG